MCAGENIMQCTSKLESSDSICAVQQRLSEYGKRFSVLDHSDNTTPNRALATCRKRRLKRIGGRIHTRHTFMDETPVKKPNLIFYFILFRHFFFIFSIYSYIALFYKRKVTCFLQNVWTTLYYISINIIRYFVLNIILLFSNFTLLCNS